MPHSLFVYHILPIYHNADVSWLWHDLNSIDLVTSPHRRARIRDANYLNGAFRNPFSRLAHAGRWVGISEISTVREWGETSLIAYALAWRAISRFSWMKYDFQHIFHLGYLYHALIRAGILRSVDVMWHRQILVYKFNHILQEVRPRGNPESGPW